MDLVRTYFINYIVPFGKKIFLVVICSKEKQQYACLYRCPVVTGIPYLSNRPQVSMVYKLINHAGCW